MENIEALSRRNIYQQQPFLCGLSCISASFEIIRKTFAPDAATISSRIAKLKINTKSDPIRLEELAVAASSLGLVEKILKLTESNIGKRRPDLIVAKIKWREFDAVMRLKRNFSELEMEEEHYLIIMGKTGTDCHIWEPSFSGKSQSPWLLMSWKDVARGNQNLQYRNESGFGLYLYK